MLGIDPGENSLSLPPPRLGTSEAAPGEQGGEFLKVVGLHKSHCASLDPMDGQKKDSGVRILAELRRYRYLDVNQGEVSKSRLPNRRRKKRVRS